MAPKAHSMSLLFHPKKKTKQEAQSPTPKAGPPKPKRKVVPTDEDEDELKLPDEPYQEFRLLSSALNGWKYDVMKFDSRKPVDVSRWVQPIKLNRKDLRRDEGAVAPAPVAVGPMLGPDGKPVIGADGKMVMVDAEGRPIHSDNATPGSSKDKGKAPAAAAAKKRFQKKTKQVFFVPEEVRRLRREERYPWVMEDSSPEQSELWIGQMEDASKSETHAFFMPAANDVFKFVPAHRWYKFQKRLKHDLPTDTVNVESLYSKSQKRDPQLWLAARSGKTPSAATAAMFKAESEGRTVSIGNSLVHNSGQSLGPGGRKLKTVDTGTNDLFDDDDEADSKKRKERDFGEEGGLDEQVYEEEFADDEEKMDLDDNDEEAKEIEERLKKEYKAANKQREAGVDESDEDEDQPVTSKQAKAMQKLIRNREGNDAYETDEEKNPYASSEEEEEEEEPVVQTAGSAIQQQQQQQIESRAQTPKPTPPQAILPARPGSPANTPTHGGHSIVAKRATSPKIPKPKPLNISRGNSPLGGHSASPVSRATSPINEVSANGKTSIKRKAEDSPPTAVSQNASGNNVHGLAPKPKKRKATQSNVAPIVVTAAELENLLVEWLKSTGNASTRDCIHHFTPYLTDAEKKNEFSAMVRRVAQLKNGVLVLKTRAASSAPSPTNIM